MVYDPGDRQQQNKSLTNYLTQRSSFKRLLTPEVSGSLASLTRQHPTLSGSVAVGVAVSGQDWEGQPWISDLDQRDQIAQDTGIMSKLRGTVRLGTGIMESLWQSSPVNHGLRTATRISQGQEVADAYRQAGGSWGSRIARDWAQGNPINMGNGWFPQSTPVADQPGYAAQVQQNLKTGDTYAEAMAKADVWSSNEFGTPITEDYSRVAESTLISKTVNGVQQYSPVSLGRVAAITVFDPNTIPFIVSSGLVDTATRISGLDPVDVPIKEVGLWRAAKNNIVPQEAAANVRQLERSYLERKLGIDEMDAATQAREVGDGGMLLGQTHPRGGVPGELVDDLEISADEYIELLEDPDLPRDIELAYGNIDKHSGVGSPGKGPSRHHLADEFDPYAQAYDELDRVTMEKHGINFKEFMYNKYGDRAVQQFDETLTHELVHADQYDSAFVHRLISDNDEVAQGAWDELNQGATVFDDFQSGKTVEAQTGFRARASELRDEAGKVNRRVSTSHAESKDAAKELDRLQAKHSNWEDMSRVQRQKAQKEIDAATRKMEKAEDAANAARGERHALNEKVVELEELASNKNMAEYDATYTAGLKLLAGKSEAEAVRKAALADAGLTNPWRPWLKPQMIEDYLTSGRGRNTIKWLAQNQDLAKQRKILNHGLPGHIQAKIAKASRESEVIELLAPFLGKEIQGVPLASAARRTSQKARNFTEGMNLPSAPASLVKFRGGVIDKVRTSGHRIGSKAVKLELNPYDLEQTLDHANAWLRTIRATDDEVNEVLYKIIAESDKPIPNMDGVFDDLTELFISKFNDKLDTKNVSDVQRARLVEDVMRDWRKAVIDNKIYAVDAAANKVNDVDRQFTEMWLHARNGEAQVPRYSAVLESQTAMTTLSLPNGHQVRQATSGLHTMTQSIVEKILSSGRFADEGSMYQTLEKLFPGGLQSSFGIGFLDSVHKVWRDMALLRIGWPLRVLPEEMVRQAAAGYSDFATNPASYVALMMRKKMANDVMGDSLDDILTLDKLGSGQFRAIDYQWDATKQSWTTVHPGAAGYEQGLGSEILQLSSDEVSSRVARDGIEDTLDWLKTDEGQKVARRAKNSGGEAIDLTTEAGQKLYVERAAALHAQYTGGEWVRQGPNGKWFDMAGAEIVPHSSKTKAAIHAEINARRGLRGEPPLTAKPTSYSKEKWIETLVEETGIPDLAKSDNSYIVIRQGDEQLRHLIGTGELEDGTKVIYPDMKIRSRHEHDINDFQKILMDEYAAREIDLPTTVRTPRNALEKGKDMYNGTVDVVFESLMAKPSAYLVRSPFFRQVYSEEMARWYLFGDAELRRTLKGWAADNGVTKMFNKHIREATEKGGFAKLPSGKAGIGVDQLDQLDMISKQRGLQRTRDLFYDLAEKNNITDMTKYIFPFADAWFEVLSRWAGLMFTNSQRSATNWRRAQVGVMNARKSGFFQEDEYGRETFNWPGAGLMAPWFANTPSNSKMDATMGLDQLMFIDPNPRGLMMPGVGPIFQLPASMVQPALDNFPAINDAVNWFAFGDFERIEPQDTGDIVQSFVPSWVKQILTAFLGDERRVEFADEVGRWYEVLLLSGDPQFGDETPDRMAHTLQQAQTTGTALSFLKVLDRFLAPATPRYEAAVDAAMNTEDPFWITALALEREWVNAQEFFDDSDMARTYMTERFGIDPLNLHASTYKVQDAPATKEAYQFLRENDELYKAAPSTMMAWIDVPDGDEFYNPAYQRQKSEGQRVILTPEQRAWAINEQAAWHEWGNVRSKHEEHANQIRANTEPRTDKRTRMMGVIDEWKRRRKAEIFDTYFTWDNQQGRNNIGMPERPKTTQLWDEMSQQGTPGTTKYEQTRPLDESMSDFMVSFAKNLKIARKASLSFGDQDLWLTSNTHEAKAIKQGFVDQLNLALMGLDEASRERGRYVMDRYVMSAFGDFELGEDLHLSVSHPDQLEVPDWADRVEPSGPGARLIGANSGG